MAHIEFEQPLVQLEERIEALREASAGEDEAIAAQILELEGRVDTLRCELYEDLSVWQKVQLSRHPDRPYFLDYVEHIFDDFVELHGDRAFADDPAIVGGFATFEGRSVAVLGHQKGRTSRQKSHRNFGMARPEGYRKAMRIMQMASRFGRPVLTFIDTPGAYPGIGAEERGQAEAIGRSLQIMSELRVPTIATVIGEGGSGGAIALGLANRVLMMQFATYSVITPEGCASILWRDAQKAPKAAEQLSLLATDAARLGLIEGVIQEPVGGAHWDVSASAHNLRSALSTHLAELMAQDEGSWIKGRYDKFRAIGSFF